ncbi:MAG TPA: hypothetical protein VFM31_01825 [Nitrososphaeraceae archaeon]|nr:hypothetical protein [Nitrososphaeraceae archaeon]
MTKICFLEDEIITEKESTFLTFCRWAGVFIYQPVNRIESPVEKFRVTDKYRNPL